MQGKRLRYPLFINIVDEWAAVFFLLPLCICHAPGLVLWRACRLLIQSAPRSYPAGYASSDSLRHHMLS